jgi:hypothetical protein
MKPWVEASKSGKRHECGRKVYDPRTLALRILKADFQPGWNHAQTQGMSDFTAHE